MSTDFKNNKFRIFVIIFVMLIVTWIWVLIEENQELLEVNFYYVGQGDGIFIETPNKKQVLIDGGPDLTILEKLGRELPFWDRYIDLIVLTHPEHDHVGGLIEVIKRYRIGGILTTEVVRETAEYREWKKVIERKNIPLYIAQIGEVIVLDKDIKLTILHPFESLAGKKVEHANNTSIVAQLVYCDFEVLLTGDIEKEIEQMILGLDVDLRSDILKVPHHGSKSSSTKQFITTIDPKIAIIQAGKDNQHGHPHQCVLDTLSNVITFITSRDGDIEVVSDGVSFEVN